MKNKILIYAVTLLVMPLLGFGALLLVHMIPVEPMQRHALESLELLQKEYEDETLVYGYDATLTGSFADNLMLEFAAYDGGHSLLVQSLKMYRSESCFNPKDVNEWHPGESLTDYLNGVIQVREVQYSRYWHGYLIALKPILFFTSVGAIRLINSSMQLILLGFAVVLLGRKKKYGLACCMLCAMPFLYFGSTFASLSQSICMYLMLLSVIAIVFFDDILYAKSLYGMFFLMTGMLTSYFDFLTYPLVTLGFPLVIVLYLHEDKVTEQVKKLVLCAFSWGFGYVWMWFDKWIIADLFTSTHTIADALSTLAVRSGSAEGGSRLSGFLTVIRLNVSAYLNWGFIPLVLLFVLVGCVLVLQKKIDFGRSAELIPFLMSAMMPFAWWFLAQNHSEEHWMFTCRIFAITIFAVLAGMNRIRRWGEPQEKFLQRKAGTGVLV